MFLSGMWCLICLFLFEYLKKVMMLIILSYKQNFRKGITFHKVGLIYELAIRCAIEAVLNSVIMQSSKVKFWYELRTNFALFRDIGFSTAKIL